MIWIYSTDISTENRRECYSSPTIRYSASSYQLLS